MAEELAPARARERPAWITDLLTLAQSTFLRAVTAKNDQLAQHTTPRFTMAVPVWMMKMDSFSIPGVWPLEGSVAKVMGHWFTDSINPTYLFPPPGRGKGQGSRQETEQTYSNCAPCHSHNVCLR